MSAPQDLSIQKSNESPRWLPTKDMDFIPGGTFVMGSNHHYPEEAPAHAATVDGFWIDKFAVTNLKFEQFVDETRYVTVAERPPRADEYPGAKPEMLRPASIVFQKPPARVDLRNHYNWWTYVPGADWRHPEGPKSSIVDRMEHPVVHLAYADVEAYAKWVGKELPTETEWEFAARGGLDGASYAWGDEFAVAGKQMANTWQGEFPWQNTMQDGFEGTAPVGQFPPNGYGLFDMSGNVWEFLADEWAKYPASGELLVNPIGGGEQLSAGGYLMVTTRRSIRGGSYGAGVINLRVTYRDSHPPLNAGDHVGFRCAKDL